MTQEETFLQAIIESPDDDAPRLIFADWLEENGQEARAELIRVQIELVCLDLAQTNRVRCALREAPRLVEPAAFDELLAEPPEIAERRRSLQAREKNLLARYARAWLGPLDGWFHRGLLAVTISERWWQRPWRRLGRLMGRDALASVLATPAAREAWRWVEALDLWGVDDGAVVGLAASPALAGMTALSVGGGRIGPLGARALAESPYCRSLSRLDLNNNQIGPDGTRALAESPHIGSLTRLRLRMNGVGDEGARALATSPNLTHLVELYLAHNDISDEGAEALIASPYLSRRLWLCIHSNPCRQMSAPLAARFEEVSW
jgi:uncharacterized protein (TIGR02996 family)